MLGRGGLEAGRDAGGLGTLPWRGLERIESIGQRRGKRGYVSVG